MAENDCKIIFVGESGVGKTSIIKRIQMNEFNDNIPATIFSNYINRSFQIDNKTINCDIWDTAGGENYRGLGRNFYNDSNIAILVFDITDSRSFEEIKNFWFNEVKQNSPENISKIIS